ncbi:MAG: GTP pyrophosphokinase family protein, partial [Streptococcus salivarius]|nr:GTP pyrophosphokinase family protein [Streptococcus salivarius]
MYLFYKKLKLLTRRSPILTMDWEEFLDPYIQAVGELKIKLRGIRK